jgi:hypothetical protein
MEFCEMQRLMHAIKTEIFIKGFHFEPHLPAGLSQSPDSGPRSEPGTCRI